MSRFNRGGGGRNPHFKPVHHIHASKLFPVTLARMNSVYSYKSAQERTLNEHTVRVCCNATNSQRRRRPLFHPAVSLVKLSCDPGKEAIKKNKLCLDWGVRLIRPPAAPGGEGQTDLRSLTGGGSFVSSVAFHS